MMTWRFSTGAFLLFLLMARVPAQGKEIRATLLYDGQTTEISRRGCGAALDYHRRP